MNETKDENAYPANHEWDYQGLTKRELFAAMAMQGMLGNKNCLSDAGITATRAVEKADALLKELNK